MDVIFRQTSMYCMAANTSSPPAVSSLSEGSKNFASVWNLWAASVPQHTAPSGSCCKNDTEMTGGMCPSFSGGHSINCSLVGAIMNSETVLDGSVIHQGLSAPTRGCKAGLRGTLSRNCIPLAVSQMMATAICQTNLAGYSLSDCIGITPSPKLVFHGSYSCMWRLWHCASDMPPMYRACLSESMFVRSSCFLALTHAQKHDE